MKKNIILLMSIIFIACSTSKKKFDLKKYEIVNIDSTNQYFVFKVKKSADQESIVIAEKRKIKNCFPLKKYIVADSISGTLEIWNGSRYNLVGHYLGSINDIRIRDEGNVIQSINSCMCFSN